jgi:hypothetical protein
VCPGWGRQLGRVGYNSTPWCGQVPLPKSAHTVAKLTCLLWRPGHLYNPNSPWDMANPPALPALALPVGEVGGGVSFPICPRHGHHPNTNQVCIACWWGRRGCATDHARVDYGRGTNCGKVPQLIGTLGLMPGGCKPYNPIPARVCKVSRLARLGVCLGTRPVYGCISVPRYLWLCFGVL